MRKILVVDDEPLIVYSLLHALKSDEVEVLGVSNAEDALEAIGTSDYDLCFLDIRLPGISGLDAAPVIRKRSPGTQIVIMTANFLDAPTTAMIERSTDYLLPKPFDLEVAKDIADQVLSRPGVP
jgi:two-component system response regulator AtoC